MGSAKHLSKRAKIPEGVYALPMLVVPYLSARGLWMTEMSDELGDPLFSFTWSPDRHFMGENEDGERPSAHEVTKEFLNIADAKGALRFFRRFGPLQLTLDEKPKADPVRLSQVVSLGKRFLEPLSPADVSTAEGVQKAWFDWYRTQTLAADLDVVTGDSAAISCRDVQECVRVSYILDRRYQLAWRRCPRVGCGRVFRRDHNNEKLYCNGKCARLQAQLKYLHSESGKQKAAEYLEKRANKAKQKKEGNHNTHTAQRERQ